MNVMKVSVVVIAKNAEKTIATCLSSILEQTCPPDEIIVVYGESDDNTSQVASQFPIKQLVIAPPKDTYGTSRNLGLEVATGDTIAFLDADDYADKDWLKNVIKNLRGTNVGAVRPHYVYVYSHNWFTDIKWGALRKESRLKGKAIVENTTMGFRTSGVAFKKEVIEKAGYFDEDMFFGTEDKDLALRIIGLRHNIIFDTKAVIYFRPAQSVKEWLKEAFYRHGLGHGTLRRRYAEYTPPLLTPVFTLIVAFSLIFFLVHELWGSVLLLLFSSAFLMAIRILALFLKTKRLLHALAYSVCEVLARNFELLGFLIGYIVPPKVLRKALMR